MKGYIRNNEYKWSFEKVITLDDLFVWAVDRKNQIKPLTKKREYGYNVRVRDRKWGVKDVYLPEKQIFQRKKR